jgi:V8-like Glu-specific endopeptidase
MADGDIWDSVRQLIREQDASTAIEALEQWLKARLTSDIAVKTRKWLDELLLHYASVSRAQARLRAGTITAERFDADLARICQNILSLLNEVEAEDKRRAVSLPLRETQIPVIVQGKLEQITGPKSRLFMVSWLERGLWCSSAVCRLLSGGRIGSGFRIQRDLLLTNNHVIRDLPEVEAFHAEFFYEERLDRTMRDPITVNLDSSRFWTSTELDLTIVGVCLPHISVKDSIHELRLCSSSPEVGDPVSIIQHPLGGPKQIALTSNEVINLGGHLVHYVTDTLPGSSGSPVFNTDWEVVAVHHAGGMLAVNSAGQKVFVNEGVLISALMADAGARRLLSEVV